MISAYFSRVSQFNWGLWQRRLLLLSLAVLPGIAWPRPAVAQRVTETVLSPNSVTDQTGSHAGSVSALSVKDQTGSANDPTKYVQFGLPSGQLYAGFQSFILPSTVSPSSVSSITLLGNVMAPMSTSDDWVWSIYNWSTGAYERLGDQNHCGGPAGLHPCRDDSSSFLDWRWNQYNVLGAPKANYVNPTTREIRIQLASSNASSFINVDWEAVKVYSNGGSGAIWTPPTNYRWQYQLTASAADGTTYPTTQGIATDICVTPFTGGACVSPQVIDFDFYEDGSITGSNDFEYTSGAVQALHASGRRAIGYVDAGDAEQVRPDYQQYVDFDNACNGCLIGNPFPGFRSEFMMNINNDQGQADLIRKMLQARTDRVASLGFDAIEYDVVDNYQNKSGFSISYQTQEDFNVSLSKIAHTDGLSAALKSDNGQAQDSIMISSFDFVIDEQCNQYNFCGSYSGFQGAGKAIFNVEYKLSTSKFCPNDNSIGFNGILKGLSLPALPWTPCR